MALLISGLFGRRRGEVEAGRRLAASVMAEARRPDYYLAGLAEDTLEGRFAMVALFGGLAIRHLRRRGREGFARAEAMGEALFDRFDHALREEGVGDHSIARRARALGEEFYGLARALEAALESGTAGALEQTLSRNGLGGDAPERLAGHVRLADTTLAAIPDAALLGGDMDWPEFLA